MYINQHLSWYNTIRGNKIGTNVAGTSPRGNKQHVASTSTTVPTSLIEDNLIRGNTLDGVSVERVPGSLYTTRYYTISAAIPGTGGTVHRPVAERRSRPQRRTWSNEGSETAGWTTR